VHPWFCSAHPIRTFPKTAAGIFEINAGFYDHLSLSGILGRHAFVERFTVTFDPANQPPGMEITRPYHA
jgi:hypothetical protein